MVMARFYITQSRQDGRQYIYKSNTSCVKCHNSFEAERKIVEEVSNKTGKYIAPAGEDKILSFARTGDDLSWIIFVSSPFSDIANMTKQSMRLYSYLIMSILITTIVVSAALMYSTENVSRPKRFLNARKQWKKCGRA